MRKRQAKKNRKLNLEVLRYLQLKIEGRIRQRIAEIDREIIEGKGALNIRPLMSFAEKGGKSCS